MRKGTNKTKKQHYVPRCYLEAWEIPNKYQVYVYDKEADGQRICSINDIASENYFYDVVPNEVFSQRILTTLKERGTLVDVSLPSQSIEHTFATYVEGPFSDILKLLKDGCKSITPWIVNNCYFISEQNKVKMSELLALQFVRTKHIRNNLQRQSNCLQQLQKDLGFSAERMEEYSIDKNSAKIVQAQMLMDESNLSRIADSLLKHTWILGINKTKKKFYTSDNPIGTRAHINHLIMSMNGLDSPGAEAFFPISPICILVMFNEMYSAQKACFERRYVLIEDEEYVDYYNSLCACHSERCIFSTDGDFGLIQEMKRKSPNVFSEPRMELIYGDKVYCPKI